MTPIAGDRAPRGLTAVPNLADAPGIERFVLIGSYLTNLPSRDGQRRVAVELLVDEDSQSFWAAIPEVGVAANGATPAEAALATMRAATALL